MADERTAAQGRCATCRHWSVGDRSWDSIISPEDPDTYEPMQMPFEVRLCTHPKLLFCERPLDFGCVRWEANDASE